MVDGAGQRMNFLRGLCQLNWRQRRQAGLPAVTELRLQSLEWPQAARDAGIDQHTEQDAQQQQGRQNVGHQTGGNALLYSQAFGYLHTHALG